MAASKEQKKRKAFAEKLLRVKGVDYDEWLDEKHQEIIEGSDDLLSDALDMLLETSSKKSTSQSSDSASYQSSSSNDESN